VTQSNGAVSDLSGLLLGSKFWIEIEGVLEAVFTDCQGLSIQTEVFEYKEGGLNTTVHRLPGRTSYVNIVLKRGLLQSTKMSDWYKKTVGGYPERKEISIILYSKEEPSKAKKRWNVHGAYPVKWNVSELKATSNDYLIETIELAHTGFEEVSV
jgi:phage tail-like protein